MNESVEFYLGVGAFFLLCLPVFVFMGELQALRK